MVQNVILSRAKRGGAWQNAPPPQCIHPVEFKLDGGDVA
jgi:hypothetical protein